MKLVSFYSTIKVMHGPINIRLYKQISFLHSKRGYFAWTSNDSCFTRKLSACCVGTGVAYSYGLWAKLGISSFCKPEHVIMCKLYPLLRGRSELQYSVSIHSANENQNNFNIHRWTRLLN